MIWRRVRLGLGLAVAAALVGLALLYWQVHQLAAAITVGEVRPNPTLATPLVGANVLLIGVDARADHPEEGVRSDTLILARLDAAGRWVSLLSIPRDSQVELLDIGTTKVNVAYGQGYARAEELYGPSTSPEQGGMALAAQTVEQLLNLRRHGMRVDYTAQVNFDGFAEVIDALGGISVDVPTAIVDDEYPTPDFGTMRVEFAPGPQRMDGARALIYARTRHADSDFGRAERQQQVLRAILHEFQAKSWPGQVAAVPALLGAVAGEDGATPPVQTTMPIDRIDVLLGLISLAGGLNPDEVGQLRISPEVVGMSENGSNLISGPRGHPGPVDHLRGAAKRGPRGGDGAGAQRHGHAGPGPHGEHGAGGGRLPHPGAGQRPRGELPAHRRLRYDRQAGHQPAPGQGPGRGDRPRRGAGGAQPGRCGGDPRSGRGEVAYENVTLASRARASWALYSSRGMSITPNWRVKPMRMALRPMRIMLRAAALKTHVVVAEYASKADIFRHNNKKFWGPAAPKPPLRGLT